MLTTKDIKNLTTYFSTIFATKQDLKELRDELSSKMDKILSILDRSAKTQEKFEQERLAISHRMDKAENNIEKIAKKTKVKLQY